MVEEDSKKVFRENALKMQEIVADKELHERYIDHLSPVMMASLLLMCPAPAKNYFLHGFMYSFRVFNSASSTSSVVTHDVRPDLI